MYDWDRKRWNGSTIGGHTRRLGQLDCCGTVILRNANSEYERKNDWGERVRLEAETAGIRKKVGLILQRQDCHRVSAKA